MSNTLKHSEGIIYSPVFYTKPNCKSTVSSMVSTYLLVRGGGIYLLGTSFSNMLQEYMLDKKKKKMEIKKKGRHYQGVR